MPASALLARYGSAICALTIEHMTPGVYTVAERWTDLGWVYGIGVLGIAALAAACANTLNAYIERDKDALMERTQTRPLPSGLMLLLPVTTRT